MNSQAMLRQSKHNPERDAPVGRVAPRAPRYSVIYHLFEAEWFCTGTLPFIPFPGLWLCALPDDDCRQVESVYYFEGKPSEVFLREDSGRAERKVPAPGWVEKGIMKPVPHSALRAPRSNEFPLKHWVLGEAAREGVKESAIYMRIRRGKYPELKLRRVNQRVVFVQLEVAA